MKPRTVRLLSASVAAALSASTLLLTGPAATADPTIPGPTLPVPLTFGVTQPYNDLSSAVCAGDQAAAIARIQSTGGFVKDIYTLAGDTVELIGLAKACQWQAAPTDALQWGFAGAELDWTLTPVGATTVQHLGSGTIVQDGRTVIPTVSQLLRTLTAADDGAKLIFGNAAPVTSPNGQDVVSAATTMFLHVVDPHLVLAKEVCLTGTGCDVSDDAQWGESTAVVAGTDVQWRLTARNTGNIALNGVTVSDDALDGGTAAANDCGGRPVTATLAPGASAAIVCTTTAVDGAAAVVNSAKLVSTFTDPTTDGRLAARYAAGVQSDVDSARVQPLHAAISLVKEVCATGTGCDVADDAQWTPRVVVPYGTDAQWRLTVTNTGDTALIDVVPSQEQLSGGKTGPSDACAALGFGTLAPGESRSLDCTTASIDDTTQDAVNHAVVHGVPADASGVPYSGQYPAGLLTAEATAAVATSLMVQEPQPEPAGPVPPVSGDAPSAPAPQVAGPAGDAPTATAAGALASTGLDTGLAATAAALLLTAGAAAVVLRRRAARG